MNTPNPNPSPELLKCRYCGGVGKFQIVSPVSDRAWATCFCSRDGSPQTLPAPGEVEARAADIAAYSGPVVSFDVTAPYYLASCDSCGWVGSSEHCGTDTGCDDSNVYCPRCDTSGADCGKIATQSPPWTAATVAAANDEGDWVNHERIRQEAYASGYRQAIDDAAMVADDLNFGTEIGEWLAMTKKDVSARACHECAAAIRLLSQGAGKAERYRHVKRGTVYEIVGRAELQVNNIALTDGVTMVVYRGEDGKLWARGEAEFMDGRFERLATSRSQHEGASS